MLDGLHGAQDEHGPGERVADVVQHAQGAADVGAQRAGNDVVGPSRSNGSVGDDGAEGAPGEERGAG